MSGTAEKMSVSCPSCGKSLRVPTDRVGKMAKCPGCMNTFRVPGTSAAAPPAAPVKAKKSDGPRIAVSWKFVFLIVAALCIPTAIIVAIFGPVRVHQQWEEIGTKADEDCRDVITRGLEANLSSQMRYDPSKGGGGPSVRELAFLFWPLVMSMPETVPFKGTTSQGNFVGVYHPRTGEVKADVEIGGYTLPGLEKAIRKGNSKVVITGRKKNGQLTVEVDGVPGNIVYWRKDVEDTTPAIK